MNDHLIIIIFTSLLFIDFILNIVILYTFFYENKVYYRPSNAAMIDKLCHLNQEINILDNKNNMSNKESIAKEILRQCELRIDGILSFSNDLDNKIFKILGYMIAFSSALVFFIIIFHPTNELLYTLNFAGVFSFIIIISLLLAVKPRNYKGVGFPLKDFDVSNDLYTIVTTNVKKRYECRFENNKRLNELKNKYFSFSLLLLCLLPPFTFAFYLVYPVILINKDNLFLDSFLFPIDIIFTIIIICFFAATIKRLKNKR